MKKVLVLLTILAMTGIASADVVFDGATSVPTLGWMNVFDTGENYLWGSAWGVPDIRTTVTSSAVVLQTNVNGADDNPTDPYWAPGALIMEGCSYVESGWGEFTGQNVTFNFTVLSNNLDDAGYITEAYLKTLDAGGSWATTQFVTEPLTVGAHSFTLLNVDPTLPSPSVQVGYRIYGLNDISGSNTADLSVVIVPEPMTISLLGLGGLLLRRRK